MEFNEKTFQNIEIQSATAPGTRNKVNETVHSEIQSFEMQQF